MKGSELIKILDDLKQNVFIDEEDFDFIERELIYKIKKQELKELKEKYEMVKINAFSSNADYDRFKEFMITYLTHHLDLSSS